MDYNLLLGLKIIKLSSGQEINFGDRFRGFEFRAYKSRNPQPATYK